jgi:hypothetical protein
MVSEGRRHSVQECACGGGKEVEKNWRKARGSVGWGREAVSARVLYSPEMWEAVIGAACSPCIRVVRTRRMRWAAGHLDVRSLLVWETAVVLSLQMAQLVW